MSVPRQRRYPRKPIERAADLAGLPPISPVEPRNVQSGSVGADDPFNPFEMRLTGYSFAFRQTPTDQETA